MSMRRKSRCKSRFLWEPTLAFGGGAVMTLLSVGYCRYLPIQTAAAAGMMVCNNTCFLFTHLAETSLSFCVYTITLPQLHTNANNLFYTHLEFIRCFTECSHAQSAKILL